MKGRRPLEYRLDETERYFLQEVAAEGQLRQRVTTRARALLALDRGERIGEIVRWLGLSRMGLWHLWQRYLQRGVEAIFDVERSGRPLIFSPAAAGHDRADGVYGAQGLWPALAPLGLPQPPAGRSRAGSR